MKNDLPVIRCCAVATAPC